MGLDSNRDDAGSLREGDPQPRESTHTYSPYVWPVLDTQALPVPADATSPPFLEVLARRRTRRVFDPVPLLSLATLL